MKPRAVAWLMQPETGKGQAAVFLERHRAEVQAVAMRGILHDLFTHPPLDADRINKGLAIADKAMLELVASECIKCDEHGVCWQIPSSGESLDDVMEAIDWLTMRGLLFYQANGYFGLADVLAG